jgi:hypothetical protein
MTVVNNPYDPYQTTNVVAGNGRGQLNSTTANYQPYIMDYLNVQQPYWLFNGSNGQLLGVQGGFINAGAISNTGAQTGVSTGLVGKNQNGSYYGIGSLPSVAVALGLPNATLGIYKNLSLQNSSLFDFYDRLIDGPTASQWEKWNTKNIDLSQTAFDDRVGVDLTYDRQRYNRGGQFLLGTPTLSIDILKNEPDYYLSGADGITSQTNPNFGRAFVEGAANNGGNSYVSDREYKRASLFGELRASDFLGSPFWAKLLGKHILNLVGSNEKYNEEDRAWQMYANSQAWAGYWNGNAGNSSAFTDRPPAAFIYLGGPIGSAASPNGLNLPGVTSHINLASAGVYSFDPTYVNTGVSYAAPWNVPAGLNSVFTGAPQAGAAQLYQNSNPANLVGWNSNFTDNLLSYNNGQNNNLLTLAEKSLRVTNSYSGSYQGYLWGNAIVGTFGWRYDEVKTKGVIAQQQPLNRTYLNLDPATYVLPGNFPAGSVYRGHSTSGGLVVHLNDLIPHAPLPLNVSLSYNDSSNFEVTSARTDVYGNNLSNPTGKTKEWGGTVATKDGKYSLRVVRYDTAELNGSSTLGNPGGLGSSIAQGLRWRNVFLYQLGGYDLGTAGQPSYRNTWTNAYPNLTAAQAQAQEDAAITGWNNIQTYLASKNFFSAWNFNPTSPGTALVDNTTYNSNPAKYAPNPASVYAYVATPPQGFTVTSDQESKGFEFDFTANPLPNWRVAINAAETTAVQNNIGGAAFTQMVQYVYSQLYNKDGTLTPAGSLPQFGSAASSIALANFGPWYQNYQLLKLQEGADEPELRKWRFNFVNNYSFNRGVLKGVGIGGGYRWQAANAIGYPVLPSGIFDLSHPYYGPSLGYIDLWASYTHPVYKDKVLWKIQLNVTNVGKHDGLIPVTIEPDGHTWATVRVAPVQEWQLTNTFSF